MTPEEERQMRWWERVDWVGAVAFVLAFGVALSLVLAMTAIIFGAALHGKPISEQGAQLLSTILGAAIGAVAVYLGQGRERQLKNGRTDTTTLPK